MCGDVGKSLRYIIILFNKFQNNISVFISKHKYTKFSTSPYKYICLEKHTKRHARISTNVKIMVHLEGDMRRGEGEFSSVDIEELICLKLFEFFMTYIHILLE